MLSSQALTRYDVIAAIDPVWRSLCMTSLPTLPPKVYVDLAYYMDYNTVRKLSKV